MSIFGISLFGSEHELRAGDDILNGGLKLLCYQNVSLIDTPTLHLAYLRCLTYLRCLINLIYLT